MISWPTLNGKRIGTVLNSSSWESTPAVIADETRSGKLITRIGNTKTPDSFNVVMHMTLEEYRVFNSWWINVCRRSFFSFGYPKIDDDTGEIKEYKFDPKARIGKKNTSANNLEITMTWLEAT